MSKINVELCWYCGKCQPTHLTHRLPNGARICLVHKCEECNDFTRPEQAVCLVDGNDVVHICSKHRSKIIELRDTGGHNVQTFAEAKEHVARRLLERTRQVDEM